MGATITFKRPDGRDAQGYLANSKRGDAPGLVVIQEWWGLSEQIKAIVDRFALAGFDALAPDLYNGVVVPYHDAEAAGKAMQALDFKDATTQTVRGAAQYLKQNGSKVGITGFCMGGAIAVFAAAHIREFVAAVAFYGLPPAELVKPADVKIPLQGHFANRDDYVTPAAVEAFETGLKAAGKDYEFFRYDADHAFANEQRMAVHDRRAAELAWSRAIEFFHKHHFA
ncbi:carboxymethylenebutenolidase [Roseiarcus fermentans]|uniref:Carboxymethylenebutenolidase n=1 Tax=Roseiarcus fermentans TaxID=1473586 RepID=A0A366FNG3_9HYPH|nr:dienelactone hydrolase family protein [Roseiarcus fermentans]RBP16172.1 carboxymethylenebutenolidase [Roseiarcus fermentans]